MNDTSPRAPRNWPLAILRGALRRCPACGKGRLFSGYLSVNPTCPACGEELHHQRADDAPAYFTIFIVGHIAVGGVLWAERAYAPSPWLQAIVWLGLALGLSLWLLPRIKGMLIGLQWSLGMHGFGGAPVETDLTPAIAPRAEPKA